MKYVVWCLVVLLLILHQDYWQWVEPKKIMGFMPYTLFYHACLSVAAAVVWWMATKFCWPKDLDSLASTDEGEPKP